MSKDLMPLERIENRIYLIRGQKVMFDYDLAALYGVPTKRLNEQVKRNVERFPVDFMFQLTKEEIQNMLNSFGGSRSQFATLKRGQNVKYLPYAFTEQGVAMLSSVLRSKRAVQVNILIMRTFVKIRQMFTDHKELAQKFRELEGRIGKQDVKIETILGAIRIS